MINLSTAKAKLCIKNGSPKPKPLPGMGSNKLMELLSKAVTILISINRHAIKEVHSNYIPEFNQLKAKLSETLRGLNMGTPNKLIQINSRSSLFSTYRDGVNFLTRHFTKPLWSVLVGLVGGKIAEKANVLGNAKNTGYLSRASKMKSQGLISGRSPLNSVCLNMVSRKFSSGRKSSAKDLVSKGMNRPELSSLSNIKSLNLNQDENALTIRDKVELKQKELVKLAEKHGIFHTKVQEAQILMVRSLLFRLHAVNLIAKKAGSQTPGVDNEIFDKKDYIQSETQLVEWLRSMVYHPNKYRPKPVKRVWIPKPGKSEKRPLGIPAIKDRALQTLVNLVLLPLVELTSDKESYGFRPYRDCKMAISATRMQLKSLSLETQKKSLKKRFGKPGLGEYTQLNEDKWILDADIKGFFDNISHDWLLKNIFLHPILKEFVRLWLKAKILDAGTYTDPTTGTPQGGIISPTLANFTLNGLEQTVYDSIRPITTSKVRRLFIKDKSRVIKAVSLGVKIVRYADDFIVIAKSRNILNNYIRPEIDKFLAERGLFLSPHKTKMFTLRQKNAQLDFLGYTFKYQPKWSSKRNMIYQKGYVGGIALYPNKVKVRNFIKKLSSIFRASNNLTAAELITKLNPIIRGWANYYNLDNSSHYRSVVRRALYLNCWNWMQRKHPTLGKRALANMYFLKKNESNDLPIEKYDSDSPIVSEPSNLSPTGTSALCPDT